MWFSENTYRSLPITRKDRVWSFISCVTSLSFKLRPCMPCSWKARTLSCKQTVTTKLLSSMYFQFCIPKDRTSQSKWSSAGVRLLVRGLPWALTIFTSSKSRRFHLWYNQWKFRRRNSLPWQINIVSASFSCWMIWDTSESIGTKYYRSLMSVLPKHLPTIMIIFHFFCFKIHWCKSICIRRRFTKHTFL